MTLAGTTRSGDELLTWSRRAMDPALHAAVDTLSEPLRHMAGYHFGWWDRHGAPSEANPGKALRPALVLLSAQAVGAPVTDAVPGAVAVELAHNFSLLHDDVLDRDHTRRGRPTVWSVFGVGQAILTGDALYALAVDVLSGAPPRSTAALTSATQQLLAGQAADLAFERREDVSLGECMQMARQKTAALMGCACALGAVAGRARPGQVAKLRAFCRHLGLAFQLVDDLLGIWGDPAVTGKPVYADLARRKKSLPVVAALTSGTPAGRELATRYRTDCTEPAFLAALADLAERAGGRTWARERAGMSLDKALRELWLAELAADAAAGLTRLARRATSRDH